MPTTYFTFPPQAFTAWDANGDPVPAAEAKFFEAGTTTPLTIYTDTALSTPHAVPQIADANGVFAPVYISGADDVKIEVRTSAGAMLPGYPVDNITGIPVGGLTAAGIVFDPTATLAETDVQAALEALDSIVGVNATFSGPVKTPAGVLTSSGNAVALAMTGENKKTLALDENTTITVSAEVADQIVELWITQGSTGGTAAWSGVDKWLGGTVPILSIVTGEIDIIVLASASDGTTIIAQHLGVTS